MRHGRNENLETGLFFAKGRFFDVWTGDEAGDKSLQFARAPAFSAFPTEWAAGACSFDGIGGWWPCQASGGHSGRRGGFASAELEFGGCCARL